MRNFALHNEQHSLIHYFIIYYNFIYYLSRSLSRIPSFENILLIFYWSFFFNHAFIIIKIIIIEAIIIFTILLLSFKSFQFESRDLC